MVILFPAVGTATESTGMPWEEPLQQIVDSLTGPFLKSASVVAILVLGMMLMFGENNGGFIRTCIRVLIGISISCAATSWGLEIFGFSGGLLF